MTYQKSTLSFQKSRCHFLVVGAFFACLSVTAFLRGDEIVSNTTGMFPKSGKLLLSSSAPSGFDSIEFRQIDDCNSNCDERGIADFSITAGELWTFLKSQGIESADSLTFNLDLKKSHRCSDVSVQSIRLSIQNGSETKQLGELESRQAVVIKHDDVLQFKPEAQLVLGLGFDFMKKFSADSKELIVFESKVQGGNSDSATITVQGARRYFNFPSFIGLTGFVAFWALLFLVFRRVTRLPSAVPTAANVASRPAG